jgi:hypothetical protein
VRKWCSGERNRRRAQQGENEPVIQCSESVES